jgi:purine-binding chemotaxis protein CheW
MHILIWKIDNQFYAVDLSVVDFIFLAAAVTPLPQAPDDVLGALNIHGQIVPVINMRKLLDVAPKEIDIKDHFVLVHLHQRALILWVDRVDRVKLCSEEELLSAHEHLPDLKAVDYVLNEEGKMILLYDLEKLIPSHAALVV